MRLNCEAYLVQSGLHRKHDMGGFAFAAAFDQQKPGPITDNPTAQQNSCPTASLHLNKRHTDTEPSTRVGSITPRRVTFSFTPHLAVYCIW